jgi:hypothetical protein
VNALAEACLRHPFANGTEGEAWIDRWCAFCVHDHGMSHNDIIGEGCDLIVTSMLPGFPGREFPWPEAWLPQPDDGAFSLPSRMVCLQFKACREGECMGDPGAEARAERVAEVTVYWRDRARP